MTRTKPKMLFMHLANELVLIKKKGYVESTTTLASRSGISQYGWFKICSKCSVEYCFTKIHPKDNKKLVQPLCSNILEHDTKGKCCVRGDKTFLTQIYISEAKGEEKAIDIL